MKIINKIITLIALVGFTGKANAQLNAAGSQYYVNRYIANPAMAGFTEGLTLNGGYRTLWSNIPGAPVSQNLTGEYGFQKVGLGLSLYNEKAGLFRQTRAVATYAYHLDLGGERKLHFGLSAGILDQSVNSSDIVGNGTDIVIGDYNARELYFDGDFGTAYTDGKLSIEASLPNMKRVFTRDVQRVADEASFYAAASYLLSLEQNGGGMSLEPKLVFRGVRGFDNIWDAGVQVSIVDRQVFFTGLYHSTQNATFGLGMNLKKKYLVNLLYTSETSALRTYANGSFELNLRVAFGK